MAEFQPADLKKYLDTPQTPLDRTDETPVFGVFGGFVGSVNPVSGGGEEKQPDLPEPLVEPQTTELESIPRLPWQIERLVNAASSGLLPPGTVLLHNGLVPDLNRYVLAWAAAYLTGSPEAIRRLWAAHRTWKLEVN